MIGIGIIIGLSIVMVVLAVIDEKKKRRQREKQEISLVTNLEVNDAKLNNQPPSTWKYSRILALQVGYFVVLWR